MLEIDICASSTVYFNTSMKKSRNNPLVENTGQLDAVIVSDRFLGFLDG